MNKSLIILTVFLVSVSALRVHQQALQPNRGNSSVPNNYVPNNNQGGYTQPGNNQGGYRQPGNNNQQSGNGKCDSSKPGYIESRIPGPYNKPYLNQPFPQRNANGQVSLNGVVFSFQNPFKLTCYNKNGSIYRWNSCFDVFNCAQMFKDYIQCQGKIVKENVQFDCS